MARDDFDDEFDDEEEVELVLFQGAVNGAEPNLRKHAKLVEAGLVPAKELLTDALARRAETVIVEPRGSAAAVKLEVDGIGYPGGRLRTREAAAVTQVLKLLSGLDIVEKKRPQKAGLKAEYQERQFTLSVESTPITGGVERLTVRSVPADAGLDKPETIGFSPDMKAKVREMAGAKPGFIAACGPPGTGVSTTAMGLLRSVDAYVYSIVTLATMEGLDIVNVVPFETMEGDDLTATLQRIIRAEHDVVHFDPLTDSETARTLAQFAEDVTVLTELPARDTAHAVGELLKLLGDAELVAERVSLLVTQRLLRKLCDSCKFAYRPHPKLLAKVGLPKETKVLYRPPSPDDYDEEEDDEEPEVCEECGGLDYIGRTAVFEVLEMTEGMKEVVKAGADPKAIKAKAREENMLTLQKDGLRLVTEGVTSLEELQRVFSAGRPKKKRPRR